MAHDVFISYANQDKKLADVLCAALEGQRIRCWIAPRDVIPGRGYGAQILQAIEASKLLVLVFSGNSNASQHVTREVERAVNSSVTILTFRTEDVAPSADLEYFISATHWLDAIESPMERHVLRLVAAVRSNIGQTVVEAPADAGREQAEREARERAEREAAAGAQRQERKQRERDEGGHREHHEPVSRRTGADNSEQSEARKSSRRWLFAAGIAAIVLAAAVMLQLRESPPAQPPASGSEAQGALEAQRDREENARLEAAAAKARADSEIAKLRAEADVAVARAEAEVSRLRAEAEAARVKQPVAPAPRPSAATPAPAATSQAETVASKARSDAAITKMRAEANRAAAKAKAEAEVEAARLGAEAEAASARPSVPPTIKPPPSAPEPSTSVVIAPSPAPATPTRADGAWIADRFCAGFSSVPAVKDQLDVAFKDGEFLVVTGRRGFEGYVSLRGKRSSDGKLKLSGYQLEMGDRRGRNAPTLEEQYSVVEGQLEGDRYQLKGQMAGRVCTVTISRR